VRHYDGKPLGMPGEGELDVAAVTHADDAGRAAGERTTTPMPGGDAAVGRLGADDRDARQPGQCRTCNPRARPHATPRPC
jgi:hypothetical protein